MAKTFTARVDLDLAPTMERDLLDQGFEIAKPPYTVFSAKKKGISCTLYKTGTLTVQGKEMDPFIEFYLEPEILKEFRHTHPKAHLNLTPRIGMDEAGKGDFFGPLCIAALYADKEGILTLSEWNVRDSKRFSDDPLLKLAKKIRAHFPHTVIRLFPQKYNELHAKFKNLNRLMSWAHTAALADLSQKTGCREAILDQFADPALMEKMLQQKKLEVHLVQKVRAEEDPVVAAASILSRAAFLEGLQMLEKEHDVLLPKGASSLVIEAAKQIVRRLGKEALPKLAKTHFKTMNSVLFL